jgi:hypothetical protein
LREGIVGKGCSGTAFDAAVPDSSALMKAILHEGSEMPPTGRMASGQTARVAAWIHSGLHWPAEITTLHVDAPCRMPEVNAETRRHRSFRPVQESDLTTSKETWVRHEIDSLILAGLREKE